MLKKFINFCLCMLIIASYAGANEFELKNVDPDFMGTYIQVGFDEVLKKTMSFDKAYYSNVGNYPILMLHENICYSNCGFHDGFAVKSSDFKKWNFIKRGEQRIIVDEFGVSHKRISRDWKDGYDILEAYIINVIFQDAVHLNNISIDGDKVWIDGEVFRIDLGINFCEGENVSLWLIGSQERYALSIEGIAGKLYNCKKGRWAMMVEKADTVYKTIPYFYWNDKNYPNVRSRSLSKDEYRFIRNLVYAKHGYIFKSEDLKNIFEKFDWYKPDSSYNDSMLSSEEKRLIKNVQEEEKEKN